MELRNAYRMPAHRRPVFAMRSPMVDEVKRLAGEQEALQARVDGLQGKLAAALRDLAEERRKRRQEERDAFVAAAINPEENRSLESVIDAVCQAFGVTSGDLVSPRRARAVAWPRQAAFYLVSKHCKMLSLTMIGMKFGNRDHTTVMHGIKVVKKREDAEFAAKLAQAESLLGGGNG